MRRTNNKMIFILFFTTFIIITGCKNKLSIEITLQEKSNKLVKSYINENEVLINTYDSISTSTLDTLKISDYLYSHGNSIYDSKFSWENKEEWKNQLKYLESIEDSVSNKLKENFFGYKLTHRYRIERNRRSFSPPFSLIIIVDKIFWFDKKCDRIIDAYDDVIQ